MKSDSKTVGAYAVIFTSRRAAGQQETYEKAATRMIELAREQPGFLGVESARGADGLGITVSYWRSLEDIRRWKAVSEHLDAQKLGKEQWYSAYRVRVCKIEREYGLGELAT